MSINVIVVGGPDDGVEVKLDDGYNHVRMAMLADPDAPAPPPDSPIGASICTVSMPVRLTLNGYRCYWSERGH